MYVNPRIYDFLDGATPNQCRNRLGCIAALNQPVVIHDSAAHESRAAVG